jgi:hypothetical protein
MFSSDMNYSSPGFRKFFTEILFCLIFIFIIGAIVILPMHFKSENRINNYFYTQPHGLLADYYYYLSIINEGKIQSWETDPYTTEPHLPSQVHVYYIWLGKIAAIFNLSVIQAYYIGLFIPLILYCLFTYLLVSYFFPNLFKWVAMGIIFFTGPFPEWTIYLLGKPIFLGTSWWTKMDPYSRLTSVPHHFFSSAMLVGSVYFYLKFLSRHKSKWAILCSLSLILGVLVYGIPGFVFFIAFGILFLIEYLPKINNLKLVNNPLVWEIIIGLSFVIPFILVYFQLTRLGLPWSINLFWEYKTFRAESYPIVFSFYLFNFGILLLFALPGIPYLIWKRKADMLFITELAVIPFVLWWLVVYGLLQICKIRLIYTSPYVFMGLLTSFMIYKLYYLIKPRVLKIVIISTIISLLLVNAFLSISTYWPLQFVPDVVSGNIYLHQSYLTEFKYLDQIAPQDAAIFTDFYMGMLVPVFSHTKTYIGHEVATLDFSLKKQQTNQFFAGQLDLFTVREIFNQHQIKYVFWDKCYYPVPPENYNSVMTLIHESSCASIYKVI